MKSGVIFLLAVCCLGAMAQTTFQEQAARLQNINAYLLDFRLGAIPDNPDRLTFDLMFEGIPQPSVDSQVGRKEEEIDPPSVVPRLRGRVLLGSGFFAGATYVPGIEYEGYEADYIGLELGRIFSFLGFDWVTRVSHTDGDVLGPVTDRDLDDDFTFSNLGADLTAAIPLWRFQAYGFVGFNDIETTLEVTSDGAFLENEDETAYYGLGLVYRQRAWTFGVEQNFTDDYLQHFSLSAGYRF
jgi:hypothetical protein